MRPDRHQLMTLRAIAVIISSQGYPWPRTQKSWNEDKEWAPIDVVRLASNHHHDIVTEHDFRPIPMSGLLLETQSVHCVCV
jgi:hypothetical protein